MPSRAELSGRAETVLRAIGIIALAVTLWLSLERQRPATIAFARSENLDAKLKEWSRSGIAPDMIRATLDSTPSPAARDWLSALRRAGSTVGWSGNLEPAAVAAHAVASPAGGITIRAAAPAGSTIIVSDAVGPIDTARALNGGASISVPAATGVITARAGNAVATVSQPDSLVIGNLLVLGNAGWETKFIVTALEEDGWKVNASMRVAPGVAVTQGRIVPIDTARYAAVIAVDASAAQRAGEIARYVTSGGGLVLAGPAATADAFASLRSGATGSSSTAPPEIASSAGETTLGSLTLLPIAALRRDAVPLERRGAVVAAAARRHVAGRVYQHGYTDTWRWRMSGGDESVAEHRAWWTGVVATAALRRAAPRSAEQGETVTDDAPTARLVAALGPPSAASTQGLASRAASIPLWWLFTLLVVALLAEWTLRRLRGLR